MATTTATIQLTSSDLTGDALSLSRSSNLSKAGYTTGLDQTSGVGRKTTTTSSEYIVFAATDYAPMSGTTEKAHKVYLANTSTTASEYFKLEVGGTTIGHLYAGDWTLIPWAGLGDISVTPSEATTMTLEYMLIYES